MDGKHPKFIDPSPKRRRDKDNPYTIFTAGINSSHPQYYISFRDVNGECHCMEIGRELFEALDQFEREDLSFMNEVDRHYEQSEQTEASINRRSVQQAEPLEDMVARRIEAEQLHNAIAQLPELQRRRLVLYYFGSFTYRQIADMEGCKYQTVQESIQAALKKLKNILI